MGLTIQYSVQNVINLRKNVWNFSQDGFLTTCTQVSVLNFILQTSYVLFHKEKGTFSWIKLVFLNSAYSFEFRF